ncbi:hypothetical protein KL86CLO1_11596 [uncultured Eubacteriales bacterium]|uniref:Uncharacterized protein n=1 Tax=uncultured Eubacteriales bacterium TaxID=172733 RepID=A0A212JRR8_9FIRM|nr:hypothetical protein KL86CLO1_11596 [uncultured Eubacteriales bacterium]
MKKVWILIIKTGFLVVDAEEGDV